MLTSVLGGAAITWIGYYNPVILPAMVLFTIGSGLITTFDLTTPTAEWFGFQVLAGLGVGPGFQTAIMVVQTVVTQDMIPVATAAVQFFQALGGSIFIAVAQAVFQNGLVGGVEALRIPGLPDGRIFINSGANQVANVLDGLGLSGYLTDVLSQYVVGLRNSYFISVGCAAAAFVSATGLEWRSLKRKNPGAPAGGDDAGAKA